MDLDLHKHKYTVKTQVIGVCHKSGQEIRNYYCSCGFPKPTNIER